MFAFQGSSQNNFFLQNYKKFLRIKISENIIFNPTPFFYYAVLIN